MQQYQLTALRPSIVLTGTITPNTTFIRHIDPDQRRLEYLHAIHYYRQFAPVYFLENSSYDFQSDASFADIPNVFVRPLPASMFVTRGKGYQEFEMIDAWLETEYDVPKRWIKITGRYLYLNFKALFEDVLKEKDYPFIIDQHTRSKTARTCLFGVNTDYYRKYLAGLYRACDDDVGDWVERIYYRKHTTMPRNNFRIFAIEPQLTGISGSTGGRLETGRRKYLAKALLRKVNYISDKHYIWYVR